MPPLPTIASHLRIDLGFTDITSLPLGSRIFWHYSGGAPSNADAAAISATILAAVGSHLVPLTASGDKEAFVKVTDISSTSGGVGETTGTTTSSRSGGSLPIGTAGVISHLIARRYRGGKPRTYLQIGTSADLSTQAVWASAFITEVNTAYAAFVTAVNAATSGTTVLDHPANISYYSGVNTAQPPWRGPGFKYPPKLRAAPLADAISSSVLASKVGSQRRRYGR